MYQRAKRLNDVRPFGTQQNVYGIDYEWINHSMAPTAIPSADFRITIEPSPENGLRETSQVMVDKPVTIRRDRVGQVIGRLNATQMAQVNTAIALVMGLADQ